MDWSLSGRIDIDSDHEGVAQGVPAVRRGVLQLFEKHRATPGAPYDETHFLDFLLANPKGKRAVYDSFRGQNRLGNFLEEVQLEFGLCFSLKDRDANYPLDKFVARMLELQHSRRGSLKSLKNQIRAGPGWNVLILADAIFLSIGGFVTGNTLALVVLIAIAAAVNVSFLAFAWKARAYLRKLQARLERG